MSRHNIQTELQEADFTSTFSGFDSPEGLVFGFGTTVGNGIEGWSPGALFIDTDASAGQQHWVNEGSKATAVWARQEAGSLAFTTETITWANGSAFTSKTLGGGSTASPLTTATADNKFVEFRCQTTATSGDNRLMYLRYQISGTGGGECLRALTNVSANTGTAHGAHLSLAFLATAGASECSGLGVACRGTLHIPNVASWAPTGTYAAGMFEIFSDGSSSDPAGMTELACLQLSNSGDSTGKVDVDTDAFILSLQGWTTAADLTKNITTATLTELNSGNVVGIRCKIGSGTYWIPAVPSASWN